MNTHLPTGYRIIWLTGTTACFWRNAKGETGKTHRWADSSSYVQDCRADAHAHDARTNGAFR